MFDPVSGFVISLSHVQHYDAERRRSAVRMGMRHIFRKMRQHESG